MIKNFSVIHCIANCEDCNWGTESHKNGQAISAIHARRYKHKVRVKVVLYGSYEGRQKDPKLKTQN